MNQMKISSEELRSLPPRPQSLPAASPKRRFGRLGRKTSDGSQQSASSTGSLSTCRSAEGVAVRQPSKSRIRRHTNRLSGVFLHRPTSSSGSMALTAGLKSSLSVQARKASTIPADVLIVDDPAELSNQITAPGILKIFGNEICEGAHYKSVLATTHSSAKELVKEALERYGLGKEEAESYVLCDTIGSIGNLQWRTEGFRVVGDNEKPLLLQSLWKPREGLARRFEIQKRSSVEEKTSKEKDTITAGINAQARKLQKSRSRVTSTLIDRTLGRTQKLWRSKSEMDLLDTESKQDTDHDACVKGRCESLNHASEQCLKADLEQNHIHSLAAPSEGDSGSRAKTEILCPSRPRGEREGEESEREETESSDDNTTQYSIHPPHDCPYLLLLQGWSLTQDFVIYLLAGPNIAIGQKSDHEDASKADILLFAADILPRHCCFHRCSAGGPTMLCPCQDAVVTRNGEVLRNDTQLSPGDVIGLGQHYLFLFKDPLAVTQKDTNSAALDPSFPAAPWTLDHTSSTAVTSHTRQMILCNTCISTCTNFQNTNCKQPLSRGPPFLSSPKGHSLTLNYEAEDQDRIVKEIVAMGSNSSINNSPPLTVSFLLCICVQYSSACLQTADLRRLLLLIASGVQSAMWEQTKGLAAVQPEAEGPNPEHLQGLTLHEVISGLCPLVAWMSNSLELLQFIQYQLPLILEWRTRKEQGKEEEEEEEREDDESKEAENLALLELRLSCVRSASEETMAVLEEVIMLAFQQCVYYITKVLYPILPGLLDCNPFRESHEEGGESAQVLVTGGLQVPGEIQQVVEVLTESWTLLSDCQVHHEISCQLVSYLFYFINASLFNSLMERGSEPGFYQWSRGVRMRANLDSLLDWAHAAGLGEVASEHTHTLSSAINLLATPRKNLLQTSWVSLRSDHPALSPAQLNHLLSLYSPASPCRHMWTPSAQDQTAAHQTADILESFDTHHPLVLPDDGYCLQLRRAVTDSSLRKQLDKLKLFISTLSDSQLNVSIAGEQQGGDIQMEDKLTQMILPSAGQETSASPPAEVILSQATVQHCLSSSTTSVALPPSPPSPPSPLFTHYVDDFSSCGADILSQKLRNLELQSRETESSEVKRSTVDPSCLLTPPNTPQFIDHVDLMKVDQEKWMKADSETLPSWSSGVDAHNEGGFVFECLSALKVDRLKSDCSSMKRLVELKEEEEEEQEEEEEPDDHYDANNEEVFSLELERGERGLGLALVDTRDTSLKVKGIFIRAVVPDSPAARCEKLVPGDRILAVNGVSLLGLDYQSGKELIQSSGAALRLLVARSAWMAEAIRTEC